MVKISLIIPFFGDPAVLNRLMKCLSHQTLPKSEYEILVIDNHSHPKIEATEQYQVFHQPIPGSYAARNLGIKFATGKYLFFTDSDCLPNEDWLEKGLQFIEENGGIGAGKIELQFKNPMQPTSLELYERVFYFNQREYVEKESYGATANLFVTREVFERFGLFDGALRSGGDQEFCQRARAGGASFLYVPSAVVKHPTRDQWRDFIIRRIRALSGNIFLLYRSEGFTWQSLREKWWFYWKGSLMREWHGDWSFYEGLNEKQKKGIRQCHFLLTKVDLLTLIMCKISYKLMKSLTMIDRRF